MSTRCLMIGNGLNRCHDNKSWDAILDNFAKGYHIERGGNLIPFPLEFERIMNVHLAKGVVKNRSAVYGKAKQRIAETINKFTLPSGAVHYGLTKIEPDSIITTNYDFLLEHAYGIPDIDKIKPKKRALINSYTSDVSGIKFYHPHGVVSKPSTMCLGYMHYAKIIADLQESISKKQNNRKQKMMILQHCRGDIIIDHWAAKFFDSDVAILGFGLDLSEIDFWWILEHRARLINQQISDAVDLVNNTIVYYDIMTPEILQRKDGEKLEEYIARQIYENQKNEMKRQKHKLLDSMNVFVKTVYINGTENEDFIKAYDAIIDDIYSNGIVADKPSISLSEVY